jgi:hypothetical protein
LSFHQQLFPSFKLAALVLFTAAIMCAQSGSSVLSGNVKDASGAPIPNAKIKVMNVESRVELNTLTNEDGLYRLGALVPGGYQIDVQAEGFDRAPAESSPVEGSSSPSELSESLFTIAPAEKSTH